ncbi:MAG: XdhC family protein [Aestuariivirga sp.]
MKITTLNALNAAKRERRAVALITNTKTGDERIVARADAQAGSELEKAFRFDKSAMAGDEFVAIHNPPLRLVIIGAVLVAQSIIPIAKACGYDITVIDPRGAFATGARFPDITLLVDWPQEVLPDFKLDARSGVIALAHDPKIDDPALDMALRSEAFYIGALGSKKSHAARIERLTKAGFNAMELARIAGPIGLSIGAMGANEIAISIMAQMTQALRLGRL